MAHRRGGRSEARLQRCGDSRLLRGDEPVTPEAKIQARSEEGQRVTVKPRPRSLEAWKILFIGIVIRYGPCNFDVYSYVITVAWMQNIPIIF